MLFVVGRGYSVGGNEKGGVLEHVSEKGAVWGLGRGIVLVCVGGLHGVRRSKALAQSRNMIDKGVVPCSPCSTRRRRRCRAYRVPRCALKPYWVGVRKGSIVRLRRW